MGSHRPTLSLVTVFLAPLPLLAADSGLTVTAAYVRMAPPGAPNTAAFMTLHNAGPDDRRLVRVESPFAHAVELHTQVHDGGVIRMRAVASIEVKARTQVELKSGADHLMLIGLRHTPRAGETLPLKLTFDDGSTQEIAAPVRQPQAVLTGEHEGH